jgi:UDP-N-acetylmuramate dehydrogenase
MQKNYSLKSLNSFGIEVRASAYSTFSDVSELQSLISDFNAGSSSHQLVVLGGGSNILFTHDVQGLVLKNEVKGIVQQHEDEEYVYVKAGGGENWHQFVMYCIERNWAGVENLSLIPGSVGAAPIQNIGAYGVELQDVFWELEAFDLHDQTTRTLTPSDCAFGYRDSIFKNEYKGRVVILSVTFRLTKQPRFNTSYGAIEQELAAMGVKELSIKAVSDAVINIRRSKLPDPAVIGNAGSFFKNPELSAAAFAALQSTHPSIVGHQLANGNVKLAAGWLIEQCGFKGLRKGDAGVHDKQALVLVNYGNASGAEILALSEEIMLAVHKKFGVELEREVNII